MQVRSALKELQLLQKVAGFRVLERVETSLVRGGSGGTSGYEPKLILNLLYWLLTAPDKFSLGNADTYRRSCALLHMTMSGRQEYPSPDLFW